MADMLSFDLNLKEIPVLIHGVDGKQHQCVLREMTGDARDEYLDEMKSKATFDTKSGEMKNISSFKGLQSKLISLCLHDENNNLIPQSVVSTYPAGVLSKLFEVCADLNGLGEKVEEQLKKK